MKNAQESVSVTEVGKRKKQKKAEHDKKAVLLIVGLVFCAFLVIIGINVLFRMTIAKYDPDIIIPGVTIGGTDVSGMNAAQAEAAVKKRRRNTRPERSCSSWMRREARKRRSQSSECLRRIWIL